MKKRSPSVAIIAAMNTMTAVLLPCYRANAAQKEMAIGRVKQQRAGKAAPPLPARADIV
jgi:hypothetical protein